MITENLLYDAEERVRSLCIENKSLRVWFYILLGISSLFGLMLIYLLLHKIVKFYHTQNFKKIPD